MGSLFLLFSEELWYYNNNHIQKAEGVCGNLDFAQVKREAGASPARSRHRDSLAFFITTGEVREGIKSAAKAEAISRETCPSLHMGNQATRNWLCEWTLAKEISFADICVSIYSLCQKRRCLFMRQFLFRAWKKASVWREIWRKL